jgi:hypothetical protein
VIIVGPAVTSQEARKVAQIDHGYFILLHIVVASSSAAVAVVVIANMKTAT